MPSPAIHWHKFVEKLAHASTLFIYVIAIILDCPVESFELLVACFAFRQPCSEHLKPEHGNRNVKPIPTLTQTGHSAGLFLHMSGGDGRRDCLTPRPTGSKRGERCELPS